MDHGYLWVSRMIAIMVNFPEYPICSYLNCYINPSFWMPFFCQWYQDADHQRFGLGGWWPLARPCAADVGHGAHAWGSGDPGHPGALVFFKQCLGCFLKNSGCLNFCGFFVRCRISDDTTGGTQHMIHMFGGLCNGISPQDTAYYCGVPEF